MSRALYVHLLPTLFEPGDLRGGTAVMIDLLRASTTIVHALAAGAAAVVACGEIDEARSAAANLSAAGPVLLGGERGGRLIEGFDLDNSPLAYTPGRVAGRTIVFTTTNGTRALRRCAEAERVLIGAFVNLQAVADAVVAPAHQGRRTSGIGGAGSVHLVCAGTGGEITGEDALCAGAFAAELTRAGLSPGNDAVGLVSDYFQANATSAARLLDAARAGRGGRNLCELGYEADIERSVQRDLFDVVPEYDARTGRIVAV
jgi:2-phosphosulfolactate phosphatase